MTTNGGSNQSIPPSNVSHQVSLPTSVPTTIANTMPSFVLTQSASLAGVMPTVKGPTLMTSLTSTIQELNSSGSSTRGSLKSRIGSWNKCNRGGREYTRLHSKVALMSGTLKSSRHFTTVVRMFYSKEISQVISKPN